MVQFERYSGRHVSPRHPGTSCIYPPAPQLLPFSRGSDKRHGRMFWYKPAIFLDEWLKLHFEFTKCGAMSNRDGSSGSWSRCRESQFLVRKPALDCTSSIKDSRTHTVLRILTHPQPKNRKKLKVPMFPTCYLVYRSSLWVEERYPIYLSIRLRLWDTLSSRFQTPETFPFTLVYDGGALPLGIAAPFVAPAVAWAYSLPFARLPWTRFERPHMSKATAIARYPCWIIIGIMSTVMAAL